MMAVFPDGSIAGTIGGGNVEYECQRRAGELLKRGGDDLADFRFVQGDAADLGMVCGGDVTVQFQHLPGGDSRSAAVLRDLIGAAGGDRNTWFLRRIQGGRVTDMGTADRDGPRHLAAPPADLEALLKEETVFHDGWLSVPAVKAGRTYIFGGGHVSRAPGAGAGSCRLPARWCSTTGRSLLTRRCSPGRRTSSAGTSPA